MGGLTWAPLTLVGMAAPASVVVVCALVRRVRVERMRARVKSMVAVVVVVVVGDGSIDDVLGVLSFR